MNEQLQEQFRVDQPGFQGSLQELLTELRSGRLAPSELDLLGLVRAWLKHFELLGAHDLDLASEALPRVAQVVELKVRLLLPRQPKPDDDGELLEEVTGAVEAMIDVEGAIQFLKARREDRRLLLPAQVDRPEVPRQSRPLKVAAGRLAELAGKLRTANYFELAREGFGFREATKALVTMLKGRRRFSFREVRRDQPWERVTVMFAALLEMVRQGSVTAVQDGPYGELIVSAATGEDPVADEA